MDADLEERVLETAEEYALYNAVKHGSDAQVGAIMGPMMGDNPDFRPHGDEIPSVAGRAIAKVNGMDEEARRERLGELAPERLAELESEDEEEAILPDLPNDDEYDGIRMRLAPNPNGPWHLGNARMPAVIGTYKDLYDGWMCCRFDDTDPETKRPDLDAYDTILDTIEYLGFEPDETVRASDRMETYYEHARELIEMGGAYTCSCSGEAFSEMKNSAEACPHREKGTETTREEFEAMVDGEYSSGEMVLRVRTDIEHKNPALRDWVAFRIIDTPIVDNVVEANLLAAEGDVSGEVFNAACGDRVTVNELVAQLNDVLGTSLEPRYEDPRPGDVRHSQADVSKIREAVGYEPVVEFSEGLEKTVEWFR